jgi:hypothetical protein
MHHVVHPVQRAVQAFAVTHVADEEAHALIALKLLGHLPLLHLVAGVDDQIFFGLYLASVMGTKVLPKNRFRWYRGWFYC